MACSPRLGIEIVGIAGVYVMQYLMKVSLWGLQKEMVVVRHQTEAVDLRPISLGRRFQITDHSFVILLTEKYRSPFISTEGNMIEGSRILNPQRPPHNQ